MAPSNMPGRFGPRNGVENLPAIPFIAHELDGVIIGVRHRDGYVNATAMCKAAGKRFFDYARLETTEAFIDELGAETGYPASELIQSLRGGNPEDQGTWVHPHVAIHLAQWLSARFAVQVSKWVMEWLTGATRPGAQRLPYHLRRYVVNQPNVPDGHFSVLTEMIYGLIGPLEIAGYEVPETIWPDISEGQLFARFLREERNLNTDSMPAYWHVFEDGRQPVRAKAYPDELLPLFRGHFTAVWLRQRARGYFFERDPAALPYLDIALPATREPGMLPFHTPGIPYCNPAQPVVKRKGWFRRSPR